MSAKTIIKMFQIIDDRNWHFLPTVFHTTVCYERPGHEAFVGIARLVDFYRRERSVLSGNHVIEKVVANGNFGACWGRFTGRTKNKMSVDVLFSETYKFKGGKIQMRRTYFHHARI